MAIMYTEYETYQVNQKNILYPGTKFVVRGGPYYNQWEAGGVVKMKSLSEKGPFSFIRYVIKNSLEWIEAYNRTGNFCVLHLKEHPALVNCIVNRPYTIVRRLKEKLHPRHPEEKKINTPRLQIKLTPARAKLKPRVDRVRLQPKVKRLSLKPLTKKRASLRRRLT